jgi:hypothetical protein
MDTMSIPAMIQRLAAVCRSECQTAPSIPAFFRAGLKMWLTNDCGFQAAADFGGRGIPMATGQTNRATGASPVRSHSTGMTGPASLRHRDGDDTALQVHTIPPQAELFCSSQAGLDGKRHQRPMLRG